MKIYVVFTGGTIGSSVSGGVISPADSSKSVLLENYIALHGNDVSFETAAPYFALSENLCAENLNSLVRCVCGIAETAAKKSLFAMARIPCSFPPLRFPMPLRAQKPAPCS